MVKLSILDVSKLSEVNAVSPTEAYAEKEPECLWITTKQTFVIDQSCLDLTSNGTVTAQEREVSM